MPCNCGSGSCGSSPYCSTPYSYLPIVPPVIPGPGPIIPPPIVDPGLPGIPGGAERRFLRNEVRAEVATARTAIAMSGFQAYPYPPLLSYGAGAYGAGAYGALAYGAGCGAAAPLGWYA